MLSHPLCSGAVTSVCTNQHPSFFFFFPHSSLSIVQNEWSRKEDGKVSAAPACCLSIPSPAGVGENVVGRGQD